MKTINTLLLAGAVAVSFASSVNAGELVLSPRAKANQVVHVRGVNNDRNQVSGLYAGAATRIFTGAPSMVASGPVKDINYVSGNYVGAASKDPQRDLRGIEFRIAPLIEKQNTGSK